MNKIFRDYGFLVLALGTVSCGGIEPDAPAAEQADIDDSLIRSYLDNSGITADKLDTGIYYVPQVENPTGDTQQLSGSILSIYYSAKVMDGTVIDEVLAAQNEAPYKLKQGAGAIVPVGLDIGLALMKKGEVYTFYIPSQLAFGELKFSTLIPAHSIIEIHVELVDIESELDQAANETTLINAYIADKALDDLVNNPLDRVSLLPTGVYHKRIAQGSTGKFALQGEQIRVRYVGTFLDGVEFDRIPINATFNFNFNSNRVIDGMDLGISAMERGERAILIIPSAYAYGASAAVVPPILSRQLADMKVIPEYAAKVKPYQVLVFDITFL